jgi:hypothetical protein
LIFAKCVQGKIGVGANKKHGTDVDFESNSLARSASANKQTNQTKQTKTRQTKTKQTKTKPNRQN